MQANTLKLKTAKKKRKVIGRGGKKGTYSGKGNKGQKARSGAKINPLYEGGRSTLVDHMKKVRGFKSAHSKPAIFELAKLAKKFKDGEIISKESLFKAGLLDKMEIKKPVKLLGSAKFSVKLVIGKDMLISASARKSVEKAGGKIESDKVGK